MSSAVYWIWLQQALGVGAPQAAGLIKQYETARAIFAADNIPPTGLHPEQFRRLHDKDLGEARAVLKEITAAGGFLITPEDKDFKRLFEGMYAPPVVLYGKGTRVDVSARPSVAIVGTRKHDEAGVLVTRRLAAGLAAGGAIIFSGGAKGLDSEALSAALEEGGVCVSFQACGLDIDYPKATAAVRQRLLENGGMLLSEFLPGTLAFRHHFRIRNRLISTASCGTLVTQAPLKSGALITAGWAREQGRDVYAAPGAVGTPYSEGSNALIKDGAKFVTSAVDILMDCLERYPRVINIEAAHAAEERAAARYERERRTGYAPAPTLRVAQPKAAKPAETLVPCPEGASPQMRQIYEALKEQPQTVGELALTLGVTSSQVMSDVTMLELRGVITRGAGQRYALKKQP